MPPPRQIEYTRKRLPLAIDDARHLARRFGRRVFTVEREDRPGFYENIGTEDPDEIDGRTVMAGWTPEGETIDITVGRSPVPIARSKPPRECRKTYAVYSRGDPPSRVGEVKGQTRRDARQEATRSHGESTIIAVAGPNEGAEVSGQLAREKRREEEASVKQARRRARDAKYEERQALERSREFHRTRAELAEAEANGTAPPDNRIKAYHIYARFPTETMIEPVYLCEVRQRSEGLALTVAKGYYEGQNIVADGKQLPIDVDRLMIHKLCRVVPEDEDEGITAKTPRLDNQPRHYKDRPCTCCGNTGESAGNPPRCWSCTECAPENGIRGELCPTRADVEHHQEEEQETTAPPMPVPGYEVYRPADHSACLLWVGGTRNRRKTDPPPSATYRSTHWIGPGKAIAWETERQNARRFTSRGKAERYTMAQGWERDQIRVIPAGATPQADDPCPKHERPARKGAPA